MKVRIIKYIVIVIVLMMFLVFGLVLSILVQIEVWLGDINNNGIVNNIDLLYWGIVKGDMGIKCDEIGIEWYFYELMVEWDDNYLDGLNYV